MRPLAIVATWLVATAIGLAIAWQTKVGPVLVTWGSRHGLHLGDVVGFVAVYSWASVVTLALLAPRSRRG